MDWFYTIDWEKLFTPEMTLPEIIVWGILLYLSLTILMRIVPKRQAGSASISDILFVVLVGGVTVEALGKHGRGVPDFVLMLATVMLLSYLVEWLMFRFPLIRRLLEEPPTVLIRNGKLLKKNLKKEMLSEEELQAQLRLHEVTDVSEVREARLESEGDISVIKDEDTPNDLPDEKSLGERNGQEGRRESSHGNHRATASKQKAAQSHATEDAIAGFLSAARRLEEALDWHQGQAAEHQAKASDLRRLLAEHGVKLSSPPRPQSRKDRNAETSRRL